MKFSDIERYPSIHYTVNVSWESLEDHMDRYITKYDLKMNPDFQRGHVWTREQQIKYVEYMLKAPDSGGKVILLNHPGWMGNWRGEFVVVDGLQRLTAAREFLKGNIPAYEHTIDEFEGTIPSEVEFLFQISKIKERDDLLKWYININVGGTPHSMEEIERVKLLIGE